MITNGTLGKEQIFQTLVLGGFTWFFDANFEGSASYPLTYPTTYPISINRSRIVAVFSVARQ